MGGLAVSENPKPHPALVPFPSMSSAQVEELAADIATNKLKHPIVVDAQRRVLDGRARLAACRLLGIEPKSRTYKGDPYAYALSANLHRLHWTDDERTIFAARMVSQSHGGDRRSKKTKFAPANLKPISRKQAAQRYNVPESGIDRVRRVDRYARRTKDTSIQAALEKGEITIKSAAEQTKELENEETLDNGAAEALRVLPPDETFGVLQGDCRKLSKKLSANSIDLVFTDPPWARMDLYDSLGKIAKRVLKPGAHLLVYVGSKYLNKVMPILDKYLQYDCPYGIYFKGARVPQEGGRINRFRLILCYRKPGRRSHFERIHHTVAVVDEVGFPVIESEKQKTDFKWQQSEVEARHLCTAVSPGDGGIILDPFCGSSPVGVAIATTNAEYDASRQFIGYEIDRRLVLKSRKKIMEELSTTISPATRKAG